MRMTRIPILSVSILIPLVVIGVLLAVSANVNAGSMQVSGTPRTTGTLHTPPPPSIVYYPNSIPDITPRTKATPSFTVADVKQYVLTHSFPAGPTVSHKPPTVVSIAFMTSQQASAQLGGEYIGLPNEALVCLVKLRGPFLAVNVKTLQGGATSISQEGIEVFDAHTGFRLLWGL